MKDYLFLDGTRKYAYHWQNRDGQLISQWDNAPHWREIPSYPYHRHVGEKAEVEPSTVRTLEDALKFVDEQRRAK